MDDHHTLNVWDWRRGKVVGSARGHSDRIFDVQFKHHSATELVTCGVKHIKFWVLHGNSLSGKKGIFGKKGTLSCVCSVYIQLYSLDSLWWIFKNVPRMYHQFGDKVCMEIGSISLQICNWYFTVIVARLNWGAWSNAPQLTSYNYFVCPWSSFLISQPYDHLHPSHSQQFAEPRAQATPSVSMLDAEMCFSACNIEKLGVAWVWGYNLPIKTLVAKQWSTNRYGV